MQCKFKWLNFTKLNPEAAACPWWSRVNLMVINMYTVTIEERNLISFNSSIISEVYTECVNPHGHCGPSKHPSVVTNFRNECILFWAHQSHAYAYHVELPDGNYELVPEADEDLANAEVNAVEVQQGPDQSSEDFTTDCASEGKHRSIFSIF
jgi:hypothetical protein